ncbi:ABC transporter permease [Aquirufa sp. 5-AUSEE-100C1]
MNKIFLVIQREYMTRVLKKSFWISSLLAPVLITAIYAIPIWLAMKDKEVKKVAILDQSHLWKASDLQDKELAFTFVSKPEVAFKTQFAAEGYDAFVSVPGDVLTNPKGLHIYSSKNIGLSLKESVERLIQNKVRQELMYKAGISAKVYEDTQVDVDSETITISETGDETNSSSAGAMILAGVMGLILYVTLLLYGSQVMNGVIEEKSNRIIEVIISSVKPYQLMLGKIIGVGLVGLTQFVLWIVLTIGLTQVTGKFYASKAKAAVELSQGNASVEMNKAMQDSPMGEVTKVLESTNIPLILLSFLFYFFVGYLLYSSLFAAIGSAVESPTEAQQFTFIVMIPIILSFLLAQYTMQDPDSTIAFWASMIPFTSPINMMVRLPYGVPVWELAVSMALLVLGFLACSWLSARIYRVGILMYGKKVTWRELAKWLFYQG